jgi:acyl transferase domain-containing protein/NADPH:quinone reductase-like Zn-dependent oxidoreductase/acyl carrier protein
VSEPAAPTNHDELLRELLLEKYEPIAIIGVGLRLPGDNETPEEFAEFLRAGRAGTSPIPVERWDFATLGSPAPVQKGKTLQAGGGFVRSLDQFDPKFFNISPKEADYIDPQHRLVLECAWEALESANLDPTPLRDGDGGVYIGVGQMDYALEVDKLEVPEYDAAIAAGTAHSAACGRVSYFLGWRGPCISVDTACSASLVALHLAVQGLRRRECSIALCGGVNAVHHPRNSIVGSQAGMLSPDGLCKTFDDSADGYSRSEGCGMLVLKRLSDARRDGDRVLALVRGSSVRQDGESGGLMVPNGTAQVALMRDALSSASLEPKDIQYVEAHGTGTSLGDPIELGAIATVFAESHTAEAPLVVGSVKTNIGHMEAAAGIGGVLKVVMQLQEATIYPHLHLKTPSRRIPWDRYPVTVPLAPRTWDAPRRRAMVNSFGFAGTISSVVLEQAPPPPKTAAEQPAGNFSDRPLFTLSAKSASALRALAGKYRRYLDRHPDVAFTELCAISNVGRAHFNVRAAGQVQSRAELEALLDRWADSGDALGKAGEFRGANVAFLFTGQGSQYVGMGRALYAHAPVFRKHLDHCDELFAAHLGRSIRALMMGEVADAEATLRQTQYTQPALFALEYALAQLWMSWGIKPNVLLGHSIGEIVAATVAGLFTLEDAIKLVAARGRLMQSVSAPGGMVAVRAPAETVAPLLTGYADVSFGAINSPEQCVISGGTAALAAITAALEQRGISAKALPVSHAFHSPLMTEVFDAFRAALQGIAFHEPTLTFVSNVTGRVATLEEVGTIEYWIRHIGEPVHFAAGMQCVQARGRHVFVEVGPSAALLGMGRQCGDAAAHLWVASLDPKNPDDGAGATVLASLLRVYTAGLPVAWSEYHQGRRKRTLSLPTYAFDNKRYWLPITAKHRGARAAGEELHPTLLGVEVSSAEQRARGEREFRSELDATHPAYLADHVVMGQVVFPGAGYVEVLFELQDAVFGETSRQLRDLKILEPLFLTAETPAEVRTRLRPTSDGGSAVEIVSRVAGRDGVIDRVHVTASIGAAPERLDALEGRLVAAFARRGAAEAERRADDIYADYAALGLPYGPEFQRVRKVVRFGEQLVVGDLRGANTPATEHLPASVLDCAMQTLAGIVDLSDAYLPVGFERIELRKKPKGDLRTLLQLSSPDIEKEIHADIVVLEAEHDRPVFVVQGLVLKRVASSADAARRRAHELRWVKRSLVAPRAAADGNREVVMVHRNPEELAVLARPLAEAGVRLTFCSDAAEAGRALAARPAISEVCWFWRSQPEHRGEERLRAECERNYRDLLALVAGMDALPFGRTPRIVLVTRGGQWLPGDPRSEEERLGASSLWGFGAVLLNEYPALRTTLLDLAPETAATGSEAYQPLLDELLAADAGAGEFQVAYRAGVRHVRRVWPVADAAPSNDNFELSITEYGQFANIKPVPTEEAAAPVGDQITVRVRAAGLNFKDVLNALGMLRQYALDLGIEHKPMPLGFEAAGTVIAAGPKAEFRPGDDVVLSQIGCMKRRVTVSSAVAVRKPKKIDFAAAAGLSAAYGTASYALHQLAQIKRGDRVLIHAAAGGVGQAAVQLAKLAGAEVFATASPRKWPMLHAQGVRHVMSSRNLDFSEEVMRLTEGRGVDIVLNSLNKEYVPAGLRCLGKHGRFVELGKIGIWTPEQMKAERPDVAYHNFDMSEFPEAEFNRITREIMQTVTDHIAAGKLTPLPTVAYQLDEVEEAFGVLSRGANLGKLVVMLGEDEPDDARQPLAIRPDETYLITGGLGALGVVAARALVNAGARHVAMVSRRQVEPAERAKLQAELGDSAELVVYQGDVANAADVRRIFDALAARPAALGGVIHAAGVLADAPAAKQTWDSIERVLQPKVYGTWLLQQAATTLPSVRFFTTYSSISAVIGAAGQCNYAAGNAFMDTLMQWRAASGLPALSINWGPWAEVGMAATLGAQQLRSIEERGVKFLKPREAMRAMWKALGQARGGQVVLCELDWERFVSSQPVASALYKQVLPKGGAKAEAVDLDALLALPKTERDDGIRAILRTKVAAILHFDSPDDVESDARFVELGLDSLAAVELKNALETVFRIPLPTSTLFDYPAVGTLTAFISQQLQPRGEAAPTGPAADTRVLSDSEADAELAALRELAL